MCARGGRARNADEEPGVHSSGPKGGGEWAAGAKFDKRVGDLTRTMSWLECGPSSVCKQSRAGPMGGRGAGGIRECLGA